MAGIVPVLRREKVSDKYSCGMGGGTAVRLPDGLWAAGPEGDEGIGDGERGSPPPEGVGCSGSAGVDMIVVRADDQTSLSIAERLTSGRVDRTVRREEEKSAGQSRGGGEKAAGLR